MENMGIDSPSSYTDLRDEAYLYYKYQDNAVEYVENELGVSAYECGKEGVEFPVYECLECGAEQLAHDTNVEGLKQLFANGITNQFLSYVLTLRSKIQDEILSICFSENGFNETLWLKYADMHKGFCLMYDLNGVYTSLS